MLNLTCILGNYRVNYDKQFVVSASMSFTYDANSRTSLGLKSLKSILLAVLMVSMSLSVGLMELNKAPWLAEDGESELEELNNPMYTTAPSITYSSSTLALSNNQTMTPITPTNSGGALEPQVLSSITSGQVHPHSLALDSNGYSHISMYDYANGDLKYISDISGSWVDISLVSTNDVGGHNSLAIDSNNVIHIAYFGYLNPEGTGAKNLMYSSCASSCGTPSSWSTTIIDGSADVGKWTSIAIDSNDHLHISYYDSSTNKDLKYATCTLSCATASSWSSITVDSNGDVGEYTSMTIDSNDYLHIVYSSESTQFTGSGNSNQYYATCTLSCTTASSWTTTNLNAPEDSIKHNSLTVDSNDVLHMVFFDQDLRDLFYSMCESLCSSASSWSVTTIESANDVGAPNSIGVDSNNGIHVSYFTNTPNYDIKYANCFSSCASASSWSTVTLLSSGHVGWMNSITVNQNDDTVHITFTDWTASSLSYIATDSFGYSVSPDLPNGLSLNLVDGTISGTPNEISSSAVYTITARNAHGSDTTTLTISVNAPPLMSYDWGSGSSDFQSTEYVNNKVSAGRYHTCAIPADGSVKCWGKDDYGQLGNGATTTSNQYEPVNVNLPAGQKAVSVGAGKSHTCALLDTGSVMCWGIDGQGQLGNGATTTTDQDEPVLVNLPTGRTAVEIMVSWDHTCAILDTGALMCWGYGGAGRLGNGETTNAFSPVSVNLPYGRTAVAVSAGRLHTCALLDTGSLMCWGSDGQGQLGDGGTKTNQLSPVYVDLPTGRTAASIAGGREYTCAILDNRSMMCWGDDYNAQLGNGAEASDQLSPAYVDLPLGREAVVITAGDYHACAILDNESTYCWGANNVGQLGIGVTSNTDQNSPVHANITTGRTAVAVSGGEYHTCAILDNSSMTCWGSDTNGELGDGGTGNNQDSPAWVSGNHAWDNTTNLVSSTLRLGQNVTISSLSPTFNAGFGAPTSCTSTGLPPGLLLSNTCVLSGKPTTLGNTTLTITPSNAAGSGLSVSLIVSVYLSVPSISYGWDTGSSDVLSMEYVNNKVGGGGHHTCAIQDDGDLKCWGDDQFGQLGNGASITADQTSPSSTPIDLGTGRTAVAVTTGAGHTCAILDNGDLKCWGRDTEGQLGDGGTNSDQGSPVSVDLGTNRTAVSVSVGDYHTCAILDNGDLKCWGWDNVGQLGDGGTNVNQDSPVSVDLGTGRTAIAISAGNSHTCAILDNGDLKCWGKDSDGQLGYGGSINNLNAPSSTAIDLGTDRTAVGITAGHSHACAILNNSDLKCWGKDNYGQLGDGGTTNQNQGSPASVDLGTSRTAAAVSAGNYHTCAILDNNEAKCWGRDNSGQLGDGGSTTSDQPSPASVSGSHTWDNTTYFVSSTLRLVQNVAMSSLSPISAGSAPTSCTSTGLPPGLSLSNTCVLSGTPTTLDSTTLIITPSNAAGNGLSVGLIVNVNAFGGSLIINTTSTEANQGSAISDITMSYTHTAAIESWVSGVTNSTINPAATIPNGGGSKLSIDSGLNGDIAAVYSVERTGATSANLTLLYKWNGTWTESTIDSSVDTDVASVAIDRQGALHIGYVDNDNSMLKYATNATGSWVIDTLGDAAIDLSAHTAISVHPVTNAVHIMAVNGSNNNAGLKHYTNETGTWLNSTISNPSEDEGYGVKADLDSDGNLHVVFRREANSVTTPHYDDLILASRLNGVWQNQTISQSNSEAQGQHFDMAIDSQNQIHVTYQGPLNQGKWIYHGVLSSVNPSSSWVLTQLSTLGFWPALAVDSNDNVHLSYHGGQTTKDQWYQTYTSGTWSSTIETSATSDGSHGAYFNEMTTDSNDDVFIFAYGEVVSTCRDCDIRITMIEGLGPSLATNPIFEVSPELPDGLTMNWRNGTISGTPTEAHANTTHTVTVTAFGATTTETFTLMVLEAPDISYAGSPFTFTKNSTVNVATPTNIGGVADSWTVISGTLPNGVTLDSSTGELVGTPTAVSTVHSIVIQATNPAGSGFTTIQITVQDEAPDISYPGSPFLWTKGTHLITNPSNNGGSSTSYSVTSGTLPAGIFLPPGSGYLIGTPTAVYATASVTITATNSAGNSSTTVSITVQDEAADISYANSPFTFTKNTEVVGETPTNAGGAVSTWAIHPAASTLPSGLLFGPSNGTIYGTPTTVTSTATFTVWANNSADSNSTTISITVQDEAADISYANSPFTFTKNTEVVGETPTNDGGAVTTWAIHPAASTLPSGLLFGPSNGTIYGTPTTVVSSAVTFTVWANNSADSNSTTISITVNDIAPVFTYASLDVILDNNTAVSLLPISTGGAVTSWEYIGTEPLGLNFEGGNGTIWGTPTVVQSKTQYLIWGNNSGGQLLVYMNITISDVPVSLSYTSDNYNLTRAVTMTTPISPVYTGIVDVWGIEPSPTLAGLSWDSSTGVISGTPNINMTRTEYTVWANNTGGNVSHKFNITINEPIVTLAYTPASEIFVRGTTITNWLPTVTGGNVETWGIEPSITGTGLSFVNGVISGTPTINMTQTDYIVWANTTGGPANFTITITINEPGVILEYNPENVIVTIGDPMTALTPIVSNGSVEIWSIYPELDNGLNFANGIISGTPTSIQSKQTYKIWANNTGGNTYHDVNITILDIVPEISYSLVSIDLTNDTTSSELPLTPSNLGGPVVSWSIAPDLSLGLSFDPATGVISGTPTEVTALRVYTVTATNTGGTSTTEIEITVLDQVPMIAYVPSDEVLLLNESVLNMVPESTGGAITGWSITPEPSAGLFFDASTGVFSGTPTETMIRTLYEITATNDVGSMTVSVNITVEDLNYNLSLGPIYLLINEEMLSLEPTSTLSDAVYEVSPDLPDGLFLGESNGTIWGTPTVGMPLKNFTIYANSSLFNDVLEIQIGVLEDSDSDGMPNQLPLGYNPLGGLTEDLDDDGDGFSDAEESDCASDALDTDSVPTDLDGDSICDALDDDVDGDGLLNDVETNTSTYVDENDTGTDSMNADTDGDGVCDGPQVPANGGCTAGPDVFPLDRAGSVDSDGDGMPDTLNGESTSSPPLVEDLDDDNDAWSDEMEAACGTDSVDSNSVPGDEDADGICDSLDTNLDLPFTLVYPTNTLTLTLDEEISILLPNLTGLGEVSSWEIVGELPEGLTFGWSPARDAALDGSIRGTPTAAMPATVFTIWANNSAYSQSFELTITVVENLADVDDEDDDITNWDYLCCFPLILLVLFCLFMLIFLGDRKVLIDAEPSNTLVKSWSGMGVGSQEDPLVLKAVGGVKPGSLSNSLETITFTGLTVESIELIDLNQEKNGRKFSMSTPNADQASTRLLAIEEEEHTTIAMLFNDAEGEPTLEGGEYNALLKIGSDSVYFSWTVTVHAHTEKGSSANGQSKQVNAPQNTGKDSKKGFSIKERVALEQKAAEDAKAQAEVEAKATEEAKAQAEANRKAAVELKARVDEEAKSVQAARAKVDADAEKVAKRAEELERIAKRAESIDFATLGVASIGESDDLQSIKGVGPFIAEKLNALGIFTFQQVGNMTAEIEEQVNIAIEFFPGRIKRDEWARQAKEMYESKKKF